MTDETKVSDTPRTDEVNKNAINLTGGYCVLRDHAEQLERELNALRLAETADVERVARAICKARGDDPDAVYAGGLIGWQECVDEAKAALSAMRQEDE